jgi:hypothetical protein
VTGKLLYAKAKLVRRGTLSSGTSQSSTPLEDDPLFREYLQFDIDKNAAKIRLMSKLERMLNLKKKIINVQYRANELSTFQSWRLHFE